MGDVLPVVRKNLEAVKGQGKDVLAIGGKIFVIVTDRRISSVNPSVLLADATNQLAAIVFRILLLVNCQKHLEII